MLKKTAAIFLLAFLAFTITSSVLAAETEKSTDYSIGWQFSRPMNGLSIKIPVTDGYFLQPVISFSLSENDLNSKGKYSAGLRFLINLPKHLEFRPYTGIGIGHFKRYQNMGNNINESISGSGCEAFFGVEYQKQLFRPSLEIAMGSYTKKNGDYFAGVSINAGLSYYF